MSNALNSKTAPGGEISSRSNGQPPLHVAGKLYVTHPDYMNALPYIERRRLKFDEFCASVHEQGLPTPTPAQWGETFELTENEIRALGAIQDLAYAGHFSDLRDHFFVRKFGNKPRVCWRQQNGLLGQMSIADFKTAFVEKTVKVGTNKDGTPKLMPLVDCWLKHKQTPRYDQVEFLPGEQPWKVPGNVYNLWSGWPEGLPRARDLRAYVLGEDLPEDDKFDSSEEPAERNLFLEHLYENACGGDDEVYSFLLGWMSDALLRPGPCEVAVIMTGPSGSGKGTFAELFGSFFGPHYRAVNTREQLTGKFNRHLMETQLVFADEVDFSNDAQANKTLRNLVTEPTLQIEPKGVDTFTAQKWFRIMLATNERHVVGALKDDRRYLVLEVDAGERNRDQAYFGAIRKEWNAGGQVALFRWLTGRFWQEMLETGGWHVGMRPETEALQDQKDMSLPQAEMVIYNMLYSGEVPCEVASDAQQDIVFVPASLLAEFRRLPDSTHTSLGTRLRMLAGPGAKKDRKYIANQQRRGYWLPPLELCRQRWEQHLGRSVDWPSDVTDWGLGDEPGPRSDEMPF